MKYVGIAAYSGRPPKKLIEYSKAFIKSLSKTCLKGDLILLLGGYWGLMKYIVDYAVEEGLKVILFPPLEKENIAYPSKVIVIKTGLSYRGRSVVLVRSSHILVVLGGEAGTIQEVVTAYTEGREIYVLSKVGLSSDKIEKFGNYIDNRRTSRIIYFENPSKMAKELCRRLMSNF